MKTQMGQWDDTQKYKDQARSVNNVNIDQKTVLFTKKKKKGVQQ